MLTGAPNGSLGLATASGWMTSELFPDVLKHFIKHMNVSKTDPALLVMDNHESHLGFQTRLSKRKCVDNPNVATSLQSQTTAARCGHLWAI